MPIGISPEDAVEELYAFTKAHLGGAIDDTYSEHRDVLNKTIQDLKDCRNELCLFCGKYKKEHEGWCDGCRWKH